MGHARALININDAATQEAIFEQVVKYGYSVRKVEELVRNHNEQKNETAQQVKKLPEIFTSFKGKIGKALGVKVKLSVNEQGKGKLVIPFASEKELEQIVKIIEKQR